MLEHVLKILIIIFLLVSFYDTFNIYFNKLKPEKELLLVKREIEGTRKLLDNFVPDEAQHFPIWPIVLGFSGVFCVILCRSSLPFKRSFLKKEIRQVTANTNKDNNTDEKSNKTTNGSKSSDLLKKEYGVIQLNKCNHYGDIENNLPDQGSGIVNATYDVADVSTSARNKIITDKSDQKLTFRPFVSSKLVNVDILPLSSTINLLNNDGFSPSTSSLLHVDCVKNVRNTIIKSRHIGKMGFSIPHSLFKDESKLSQHHFSKTLYENNSEILTVNNRLIDEANVKSEDSFADEISLLSQDHIMELLSICNNNVKLPFKSLSEKATCTELLTYTDNDMKNLEKRLESVEHGLKRSEERTKDWSRRINVAEMELVDLHEQMYTIFSKLEEGKKPNYIIVSQVPNESQISRRIKEANELSIPKADETAEESKQIIKSYDINHQTKRREKQKGMLELYADEHISRIKEKNKKITSNKKRFQNGPDFHEIEENGSINKINTNDGENVENSEPQEGRIYLTQIEKKSVALEAILEKKSDAMIRTYTPHIKKDKQTLPLSVPPHILPPYRRSTFAGTDSKTDLLRPKKKYKNSTLVSDDNLRPRKR